MSSACELDTPSKGSENSEESRDKLIDIIRLISVVTVLIFVVWLNLIPSTLFSKSIILVTVIICGYPVFKESFNALKKGHINMELSMVIAILASLFLLQLLPAIVITFFALLSEFIEELIVKRGRKNIELLYKNAPKTAIVKKDKTHKDNFRDSSDSITSTDTYEVPVNEVKIGDIVIVREGDTIPIDGKILYGTSTIDQSTITGESIPSEKKVEDFVYAGTINLTDKLEIKCEKTSEDSTYSKIIHLVEESEASKAPIQKLSDKMATRLVQFAIGLSALTYIITQDLMSTLSVIVVAGACGLAVGTPIALLASNSTLAKKGIIVKGGIQIENIRNSGTVIFDKTGTLTIGKPIVKEIISFYKTIEPRKILEYASIVEKDINHPLAKAIMQKASEENVLIDSDRMDPGHIQPGYDDLYEGRNKIKIGKGVSVINNGHRITVGNQKFIEEQLQIIYNKSISMNSKKLSCSVNNFSDPYIINSQQVINIDQDDWSQFSSTTVFVAVDSEIIGAILLEDKLRKESKDAIKQIESMGINTIMLTGDNEIVAEKIAKEVGIRQYYANLLPQDKVSKIKEIINEQKKDKKHRTVIMVGDGINDAPPLAEADVGIAMGKTGTDIAIETADVVLMTEDLTKIPYLIKSSRRTLFTIQQNFVGTLIVDGIGFILAFGGLLNPLLAVIIHVGSELAFIINSSRLLGDPNPGYRN